MHHGRMTTRMTAKGSFGKDVRCFNCGGIGHESKDCNSKSLGRKCFACNKFEHVANEYMEKKSGKYKEVRKSADVNLLMVNMNSKFHKKYEIGNLTVEGYVDLGSMVTFVQENIYKQIGGPKLCLTEISLIGMSHNGSAPLNVAIGNDIHKQESLYTVCPNNYRTCWI